MLHERMYIYTHITCSISMLIICISFRFDHLCSSLSKTVSYSQHSLIACLDLCIGLSPCDLLPTLRNAYCYLFSDLYRLTHWGDFMGTASDVTRKTTKSLILWLLHFFYPLFQNLPRALGTQLFCRCIQQD